MVFNNSRYTGIQKILKESQLNTLLQLQNNRILVAVWDAEEIKTAIAIVAQQ